MEELMEKLLCAANEQVNNGLENVNTCELGEVIDMIKDLSEAIYHCKVVEAMEHGESIPYVSSTMQKDMVSGTVM